jgi:hypothetical protein
MMREEVCDAEGDFEFLNVPDGNYYLVAKVIWAIPGQYNQNYQGGGMMKRVSVNDGEHVKVLISP